MTSASSHSQEDVNDGVDDGGFGRYSNGRHQRQLQQRTSKQQQLHPMQTRQRESYADPMRDGTLRGYTNPNFHASSESCQNGGDPPQSQSNNHRQSPEPQQEGPQVFTVAKVAFQSPPPGETSTDWPDAAWQQPSGQKRLPCNCNRTRLIIGGAVAAALVVAIILVIALPVTLIGNRSRDTGSGKSTSATRQEATGQLREISCGLVTASTVAKASTGDTVYRFSGIPYALPPNGTRLMGWARPIDSQAACAVAWGLTPQEALDSWFNRRLRYPYQPASAIPMCLQYQGMGADSAAALTGSPDCLYLDIATPSAEPGRGLPTVLVLASVAGVYTPTNLLLDPPDDLVASTGTVFVSLRHRVGPLAYFTHPDLTDESSRRVAGNMAVSDLVMALRWLAPNVRSFGGAPNNVVLMGIGTSGTVALSVALTGIYNSLFHKLWISSAPVHVEQTLAAAERLDSGIVPCLRASCRATLNVNSFVASVGWSRLNPSLQTDFFDIPALVPAGTGTASTRRGFIVIDGVQVPDSLINLATSKVLTKPLMLGSMLEDAALYLIDPATPHWTDDHLTQYIDLRLSAAGVNGTGMGARAISWYRSRGYWNTSSPTVLQKYAQLVTDLRVTCALADFSNRLAAGPVTTMPRTLYRYLMTARPPQPLKPYEWSQVAYQAAFGGYDWLLLRGGAGAGSPDPADVAAWRAVFAEFARTGKVASWRQYDTDEQIVNVVPDRPAATHTLADSRADVCDMWATMFPNLVYRGWYS